MGLSLLMQIETSLHKYGYPGLGIPDPSPAPTNCISFGAISFKGRMKSTSPVLSDNLAALLLYDLHPE